MPSTFDNTYHYRYSEAVYDADADKKRAQINREWDEVFERKAAPVPTQEQENEYMDFLEESFRSDPWLTVRFRKYMAGPKRIPWKNARDIQASYRWNFAVHWALGSALFWPVAVLIGRRMKRFKGGVPVVPQQRFNEDWPNVQPATLARRTFYYWGFGSSIAFGYVFAKYMVNQDAQRNMWYNRPDLKPYPAMVKDEREKTRDITQETMKTSLYASEKWKQAAENRRKSAWYRFLFPRDADFEVRENPYAHFHRSDIYNTKRGHYSSLTNDFQDHLQQ